MIGALYTGANGLYSREAGLDTISNNLANLNTVGFKKSSVNFYDMVYQQVIGNSVDPSQVGIGDSVAYTDTDFSQGTLLESANPTAVAVDGNGLFVLEGQSEKKGASKIFYSRAGDFSFDASANFVNENGNIVMGWMAEPIDGGYDIPVDSSGLPTGTLSPINISGFQVLPAVQTSQAKISANLNSGDQIIEKSSADAGDGLSLLFDDNGKRIPIAAGDNLKISFDGGLTYTTLTYGTDFSTLGDLANKIGSVYASDTGNSSSDVSMVNGKITINNSGSTDIAISIISGSQPEAKFDTIMENLSGTAVNGQTVSTQPFYAATHSVHAYFYDASGSKHLLDIDFRRASDTAWNWQADLGDTSGTLAGNSGSIEFNPDGTMLETTSSPTINYTPSGSNTAQSIMLNLWNTDSGAFEGNTTSGLTSFAIDSATTSLSIDGNSAGSLNNVQTDSNGNINGVYSNGKTVPIAKIAIATFQNNQGLSKAGNSLFSQTVNSGAPNIGISGVSRGTILPGKLEASNVDLSSELVAMLTSQRSFQANSKSITTADSMLQTAIQLKR